MSFFGYLRLPLAQLQSSIKVTCSQERDADEQLYTMKGEIRPDQPRAWKEAGTFLKCSIPGGLLSHDS